MKNIRISIVILTSILISIGIIMVYSSSAIYAYQNYNNYFYFLQRHLLAVLIGALGALGAMAINPQTLFKHSKKILISAIMILSLVLIPGIGHEVGGARRWLAFGALNFQPAEFAKLAVIIYLAAALKRKKKLLSSFRRGFLPLIMVSGLVMLLIVSEPDLGTVIALGTVSILMFFASGMRLSHLSVMALSSLGFVSWLIYIFPYRRRRIISFLNPWLDAQGSGFQIIQSFIAIGSGGVFGLGLGQSRQKLFYLPQSHTDFIFSIIGEELGLIGVVVIIMLFMLLFALGVRIALRVQDDFNQLLAFGLTSLIGIEAFINIAVASGSVPTKGLPLPFISYGGTNLVCKMISIGLLLNLARDKFSSRE